MVENAQKGQNLAILQQNGPEALRGPHLMGDGWRLAVGLRSGANRIIARAIDFCRGTEIRAGNSTVTAQPRNCVLNQPDIVPTHLVTQETRLIGSRRSRLRRFTHLRVFLRLPRSITFAR